MFDILDDPYPPSPAQMRATVDALIAFDPTTFPTPPEPTMHGERLPQSQFAERLYDLTAEELVVASVIVYPEDNYADWRAHGGAFMLYDPTLRRFMELFEAAYAARGAACLLDVLRGIDREAEPTTWATAFDLTKSAGGSILPYLRSVALSYHQRQAHKAHAAAERDFLAANSHDDRAEALRRHKAIEAPEALEVRELSKAEELAELNDALDAGTVEGPATPTRIRELDRLLGGGVRPGRLYVVAARPGYGKTSLVMGLTIAACDEGKRVAFVSLEMSKRELQIRQLSWLMGLDSRIRPGGEEEFIAWSIAKQVSLGIMHDHDLAVRDSPPRSMSEVTDWLHARNAERHVDLVVVDYLQRLPVDKRAQREDIAIGENVTLLKTLAMEMGTAVLLVAQPNRQQEGRGNARYRMSDLRGSGQIEQDADFIGFLWRPVDGAQGVPPGYTELQIPKHRHGPTGNIRLHWDGPSCRYTQGEGDIIGAGGE